MRPGALAGGEGQELLFAHAFEVANHGIWVVRDRRTRYANRRMAEMLGRGTEELLAIDVFEHFEPADGV